MIIKRAYVYAIIVDGVVRYIGKGSGDRPRAHMKMVRSIARRRAAGETVFATHLYNRLTRAWLAGCAIEFAKIVDGLSDTEAFIRETIEIAAAPKDQLWNMASGGTGFSSEQWSDPVFREKMAGRKQDSKKRSEIARRLWDDPQTRAVLVEKRQRRAETQRQLRQAKREEKLRRWAPYSSWNEYQKARAEERRSARPGYHRTPTTFTSETAKIVQLNAWRDPKKRAKRLAILGRLPNGQWRGRS